jgi:hypothetical protein
VGREFALPHHPFYYQQFIQRSRDLIQAQYSSSKSEVNQFIEHYHIDFWLIDRHAFTPDYFANQDWLIHSSLQTTVAEQIRRLQQGQQPVIQQTIDRCTVASTPSLILLKAACIRLTPTRRSAL